MIISASRRTDIPAFYSDWLLNRLRAGFALVRNPFNPRQVSRVVLDPQRVDCLVLWTKNPAPLMQHLDEIDRLGYHYYFQFTLTGYGLPLEPQVPDQARLIATFRRLAARIGPERVLWRFDPIVCTPTQPPDQVVGRFARLAKQLHGYTCRCTISFLSLYAKCRRNLRGIPLTPLDDLEKCSLGQRLAAVAGQYNIRLCSCCDPVLTDQAGIESAHCIDGALLAELLGTPVHIQQDRGQRPGCGCAASVDIGAYDTCAHGCRYCYANTSPQAVLRNRAAHDPHSPLLIGNLIGTETVRERPAASIRIPQQNLFAS
jgi:hypothetical protein